MPEVEVIQAMLNRCPLIFPADDRAVYFCIDHLLAITIQLCSCYMYKYTTNWSMLIARPQLHLVVGASGRLEKSAISQYSLRK